MSTYRHTCTKQPICRCPCRCCAASSSINRPSLRPRTGAASLALHAAYARQKDTKADTRGRCMRRGFAGSVSWTALYILGVAAGSIMSERFHSRPAAIGPSVLAADMSRLMEESLDVERQGADYIHLDVMDGHFVPNLTFGAPVIKGLRKHTKALLDAHLMVSHPAQWVDDMAAAGVDRFTFHVEATDEVAELIVAVKAKGMGVGVALKPATPVEEVFPFCDDLDLVLIMTVEPGFGGQSFMADQMSKVKELRRRYPDLDIEVDGGLADKTIEEAARAGANLIVCGSYIFKGNKAERINLLKQAVEKYGNGKKDEELTPCVVVGSEHCPAVAGVTGADTASGGRR